MLALAILPVLLTGASVCPDLTGRYAFDTEDGPPVQVIVSQVACREITIVWREQSPDSARLDRTHRFRLDGRFRPDSGWFGASPRLTAASFVGDTLNVPAARIVGADTIRTGWRLQLYRLSNGDLCTVHFLLGHRSTTIALRTPPVNGTLPSRNAGDVAKRCR
jgi:hypothetical protein